MTSKKARTRSNPRFWGFADWTFIISKAMKEIEDIPEAGIVLLNLKAHANGHNDNSVKCSYSDGPFKLHPRKFARGIFSLIRIGLIERVDPGGLEAGKSRKAVYAFSRKWVNYDPGRPGQLMLECPHVPSKWKEYFDKDGKWKNSPDRKHAPNEKSKKPAL